MIETLLVAFLASTSPTTCTSTLYGYRATDVYPGTDVQIGRNDHLAGGDVIWYQANPRDVVGVAHRTLPLGSWVVVENPTTGQRATLRVIDRGPYGAIDPETGEWFSKSGENRNRPGRYRGCLDLTYQAGVMVGHSGRQRVALYPIPADSELAAELNAEHGTCPPAQDDAPTWWQNARNRCIDRGYW